MKEEIRNLKDFLLVYNQLTESCFKDCITDLNQRQIADPESACVGKCVEKHMFFNRKIAEVFARLGPEVIHRQREQAQVQPQ